MILYLYSSEMQQILSITLAGVRYYPQFEASEFFANDIDVVIFAVSVLAFEDVLKSIPSTFLEGKLVVDVLSVKTHAKEAMLENLPHEADIL